MHGVTRDESREGVEEPEALAAFLGYLRDGGDRRAITSATTSEPSTQAMQRHWGVQMLNRSLDTMDLTLLLERDGAFAGRPPIRRFTLDALCEMFGVIPHDRHTAAGDAFITAQVFLRLLRLAARNGRATLGPLSEPFCREAPGSARNTGDGADMRAFDPVATRACERLEIPHPHEHRPPNQRADDDQQRRTDQARTTAMLRAHACF